MPNFSGKWNLNGQLQGIKQGTWTGILVEAGESWIWGLGTTGELGDQTIVSKSSPSQLDSAIFFTSVSNANAATVGIKPDGTMWAWGSGYGGRLGQSDTINKSSPVQIGALTNWSKVRVGQGQTLAIKTDGTLWAWGRNNDGALGLNDTIGRSSPVQVGSNTWSDISAGLFVSFGITTTGELYAWGNPQNDRGNLGTGDNISQSSPTQVGALTTWEKVLGGQYGTMAKKTDGTLWVWGDNRQGQVGDNTLIARSSPVQLGALTTWTNQFGTWGYNAAGAIKNDGTMWTWGRNSNGALGQNNNINQSSPVQVGSETYWSQMCALYAEGFVALTTDGKLYSWGLNNNGQLGQGDTVSRSSPTQIGTDTNWSSVPEEAQYTVMAVKDLSYRTGMS